MCGINFNGKIAFEGPDEERVFDSGLGIDRKTVESLVRDAESLRIGTTTRFQRLNQLIEIHVNKPRETADSCDINMNFESKIASIEALLGKIAASGELHTEFITLLKAIGIGEIK